MTANRKYHLGQVEVRTDPRCHDGGDEELGPVGIRTCVDHGKKAAGDVSVLEVLVGEPKIPPRSKIRLIVPRNMSDRRHVLFTVDGLAASAVASGEVTSLTTNIHEYQTRSHKSLA